MVYLIHFEEKFHHAQHYIGFTENESLISRMERHRSGTGSKLIKAIQEVEIDWKVVRVWLKGDRNLERKLKNRKNAKKLCPVCKKECSYEKVPPEIFIKFTSS